MSDQKKRENSCVGAEKEQVLRQINLHSRHCIRSVAPMGTGFHREQIPILALRGRNPIL